MRFFVLMLAALSTGCVIQGGSTVSGEGKAADSELVSKLKKRLEQLESRVDRLGLAGGATASTAASAPAQVGGQLRIAVTEPNTLNDILDVRDWYSVLMGRRMMESLVDWDPRAMKLYGLLAERWEVSDDQKTVTFFLRKNVKWHDGESFDADDVVFTWKALFNPSYTTSKVRTDFNDAEKLEKVDQYTVRVTWKKVFFNAVGVMEGLAIMPEHVFAKDKTDFNKHPYHRAPIGTGSYQFGAWKTGDHILLKRNKNYWGKDLSDPPFVYPKPSIGEIKFIVISEAEVRLQAFKRGDLDYTSLTPDQFAVNEDTFRSDPSIGISQYALPSYSYAVWNGRRPQLKDKRVRIALAYAMNRDAVIEHVYRGAYKRITGPFLPESDAYNHSLKPRGFDLVKSADLFKEAGWTRSAKGKLVNAEGKPFKFEMLLPASSKTGIAIATIYKKDLSRLGIDMEIKTIEWATFLKSLNDHDFDFAMLGWRLGYVTDPYGLWHSTEATTGSNYHGLNNKRMDELVTTIRGTMDAAKRDKLCQEVHKIVYDEQPYLFISRPAAKVAYRKYLKNFQPLPIMTVNDPRGWWIDQAERKRVLGK
jgi:peptide/nickel transport system substrate-binding protein